MGDLDKGMREVEETSKEAWRKRDGESLSDKIGNAGDDIRKEVGNLGDDVDDAVTDSRKRADDRPFDR